MQGQSVKQFPLCRVGSKVANQTTLGSIRPELF